MILNKRNGLVLEFDVSPQTLVEQKDVKFYDLWMEYFCREMADEHVEKLIESISSEQVIMHVIDILRFVLSTDERTEFLRDYIKHAIRVLQL